MRVAAMLLILAAHLPAYGALPFLAATGMYTVFLGLTIFVFVSGYSLAVTNWHIESLRDVRRFLLRRIYRLFPLYIPAVVLFIVMFHILGAYHQMDMSPFWLNTASHVLGLQGLLSPQLTPMFTLWYVGVAQMYYIAFVVLARYSRSFGTLCVLALLVLATFAGIRLALGLVDNRFFMYFPAFFLGILAARTELLRRPPGVPTVLVLTTVAVLTGVWLWEYRRQVYDASGSLYLSSGLGVEALRLAFTLSSVGAIASLSRRVSDSLHRGLVGVITFASLASYAVYLYHRLVLSLAAGVLARIEALGETTRSTLITGVGVPVIFVLGYGLQAIQHRIGKSNIWRRGCPDASCRDDTSTPALWTRAAGTEGRPEL